MHLLHNAVFPGGLHPKLLGHVIECLLQDHSSIGGVSGLDGNRHGKNTTGILHLLLRLHRDVRRSFQKRRHTVVHEIHVTLGKHRERVSAINHRGNSVLHGTPITPITVDRESSHSLHHPSLSPTTQEYIVRCHENGPHPDLPTGLGHNHWIAMGRVVRQQQHPRAVFVLDLLQRARVLNRHRLDPMLRSG